MVAIHNLGFSRVGAQRQLKFALESFWQGRTTIEDLLSMARHIRRLHWREQLGLDWVPVADFSLYDHVLDTSILLGHIPERFVQESLKDWELYFAMARGRTSKQSSGYIAPAEMTKWFDTNYHYIVPELTHDTQFSLNSQRLLQVAQEAHASNLPCKVVLLGPMSYLWLSKSKDGVHPLALVKSILPIYRQLLSELQQLGVGWVQMDEPIVVCELESDWQAVMVECYHELAQEHSHILLTTYFGDILHHLSWVSELPVAGLHVDGVRGQKSLQQVHDAWPKNKVLSVGIVDGRNIWKTNLDHALDILEPLFEQRGSTLWLAPSCSLLHVPIDLRLENNMPPEVRAWMAFGVQKLEELRVLKSALLTGRQSVKEILEIVRQALHSRKSSSVVVRSSVQTALKKLPTLNGKRVPQYAERIALQQQKNPLPLFPTTTIGSFPQTSEIRQARHEWKKGIINDTRYHEIMQSEICRTLQEQEALGLDVLVHGEPERNDMVEYFGQHLAGFTFSEHGWVQSYGSRCVKPPIIVGDVERVQPITLSWILYAQSKTLKPVKGMLTGPVTILNWSFVRDDQSREKTCQQLALALREEVLDLEKAGVSLIQIDEAALREGLPLRKSEWNPYLKWAVECFRVCTNGVQPTTQIHTHMCYSEFNAIIPAIVEMDADVITIENSRSNSDLLKVFENVTYPNQIGPGVYDIHSPNIPSSGQMKVILKDAMQFIPPERLWVNPDCGLKTRRWSEVRAALSAMVAAAKCLRSEYQNLLQ